MTAARIARDEIGFEVVGLGCFNREMARPMRKFAATFGLDALVSDDYLEVEKHIQAIAPELILGTQMERHIGKRLGIPCAVISAPVHVQDFPARYSPQMGPEGANVIFDTWVHPLVMGLEEHLLTMFREDFEFHDEAGPSHHAAHSPEKKNQPQVDEADEVSSENKIIWLTDAEKELKKIPFFVRGKARKNTEKYAENNGFSEISIETLYEAKAHYAR
jgi:light-independent protochlorophyllide reductase subunit B